MEGEYCIIIFFTKNNLASYHFVEANNMIKIKLNALLQWQCALLKINYRKILLNSYFLRTLDGLNES